MQSANYVPGVSGWKMHKDGRLEVEGVVRVVVSPLPETEPAPFIIQNGVTYISQAVIVEGAAKSAVDKFLANFAVKMELKGDRYICAGIGLGLDSQFLVSADRFAVNGRDAGQILDDFASHISATAEQIKPVAETVRDVLREELKPCGILHRK